MKVFLILFLILLGSPSFSSACEGSKPDFCNSPGIVWTPSLQFWFKGVGNNGDAVYVDNHIIDRIYDSKTHKYPIDDPFEPITISWAADPDSTSLAKQAIVYIDPNFGTKTLLAYQKGSMGIFRILPSRCAK